MGSSFKSKTPGFRRLYKRKIINNKLKAGLTETTIEQSDSSMKNNQDISVVPEVVNAGAYLTEESSKTYE